MKIITNIPHSHAWLTVAISQALLSTCSSKKVIILRSLGSLKLALLNSRFNFRPRTTTHIRFTRRVSHRPFKFPAGFWNISVSILQLHSSSQCFIIGINVGFGFNIHGPVQVLLCTVITCSGIDLWNFVCRLCIVFAWRSTQTNNMWVDNFRLSSKLSDITSILTVKTFDNWPRFFPPLQQCFFLCRSRYRFWTFCFLASPPVLMAFREI